jgi:hypothetical protein
MQGVLTTIKPYTSRHGGQAYKCIINTVDEDNTVHTWSLQIYSSMKNFRHWSDIVQQKLINKNKWAVLDRLTPLSKVNKTLNADAEPIFRGLVDRLT